MTQIVKHRTLVVRNTMAELEAAVNVMLKDGWDFDPDNKTESLQEAFINVMHKKQNVALGLYMMGPPKT